MKQHANLGSDTSPVAVVVDIDERKQAEAAMRTSEERRRLAVDAAELGVWHVEPGTRATQTDERFRAIFGTTEEWTDYLQAVAVIHPDDQQAVLEAVAKATRLDSPAPYAIEYRIIHPNGTLRWISAKGRPSYEGTGEARRVKSFDGTVADITERKLGERLQSFLLTLSDALRPVVDPEEILRLAADLLGEHLQVNHALYGEVRGEHIYISYSYANGVAPMVGTFHPEDFGKRLIDGHRAGRLQVCVNTASDPVFDEQERNALLAAHVGAYIAVPLVKQGVWVAVLSVHHIRPRDWAPTEVEAVQEVAERTWAAVERTRAERALRRSEEKYRSLFELIDEGVSTIEVLFDEQDKAIDYRFLEFNSAHEALSGLGRDVIGKRGLEVLGYLEQSMMDRLGLVARTGQPIRFEEFVSGLGRWFDIYVARDGGSDSRRVISVFKNITERKRREANLRFLAELSMDFAPLMGAADIMRGIGERVAQYLGLARCNFAVVDMDLDQIDCIYAWRQDDAMSDLLGKHRISDFLSESGRQHYATGQLSVISDAQNNPLFNPLAQGLLDHMCVRSIVDVPYIQNGRWKFLLTVARSSAGKWHEDEIELIRDLAERTYIRVERSNAEEALRASEVRQSFLLSLSDSLRPLRDPLGVQRVAVAALGRHLGVNRVLYFEVQADGDTVRTGPAYLDGVDALPPLLRMSDFGVQEQYRRNESSVVYDVNAAPLMDPALTELYAAIEVRAAIGVPLIKDGRVVSIIGVHQTKPRTWTASDVGLIEAVAERTWEAVERARTEDALLKSEARLQALIANLPGCAVFVVDTDLRYLVAEGEAITDAGLTSTDFLDKSIQQALPANLAAEYEPYFRKALAGEHFEYEHVAYEHVYLTRGAPLRTVGGEIYAVLAASFDITERKNIELNLIKTTAFAEKANRAKSDFLSNMTHELRTPLNSILGFAQLMESGTPALSPDETQFLKHIINGGWYLLDLVNELLDLAQIESGKLSVAHESVSLAEVLSECRVLLQPQADLRGITMTFSPFSLPGYVRGDRTRVKQVVINLLSNAVKYNKAHGAVLVEYALVRPDAIRVSVRDTGEGLTPEKLDQLFQPFNRLGREGGPQQGTGIGLVMSKRLVELMGGAIGVDSAVGVGSVFWVELNWISAE